MRRHYEELVGVEWLVPGLVAPHDGYMVHVLPHRMAGGLMRMRGLARTLRDLRPDVVYSLSAIGWIALEAALLKPVLGYTLFTGSHTAASTFPLFHDAAPWYAPSRLKVFVSRAIPGRLISLATERCYGPTVDCAEIAWRYFGVQRRKVGVMHLGVDTDVYFPVRDDATRAEREDVRRELGVDPQEIVAIYTGKLTPEKHTGLLVQAVGRLRQRGLPFRALVIGEGPQRDEIAAMENVVTLPYQRYDRLARYYRASDVAVWPTNESTSMLDAAACGLPLIVSDGIVYRDHVDGSGLVYTMNDLDALVAALERLSAPEERARLGAIGAEKMATRFSWLDHARRRLDEYEAATVARRAVRP
jgi:glycosyltransferase involved in cell wall biosynthesis